MSIGCLKSSNPLRSLANSPCIGYNEAYLERRKNAIFNIGFSEVVLVLLIAFLVVGPKDLPKVARWMGRSVKKLRAIIREVKQETGWDEIETEIRDTKAEVKALKNEADITSELKDASAELDTSLKSVQHELNEAKQEIQSTEKS